MSQCVVRAAVMAPLANRSLCLLEQVRILEAFVRSCVVVVVSSSSLHIHGVAVLRTGDVVQMEFVLCSHRCIQSSPFSNGLFGRLTQALDSRVEVLCILSHQSSIPLRTALYIRCLFFKTFFFTLFSRFIILFTLFSRFIIYKPSCVAWVFPKFGKNECDILL